ncbi:MAG: RDD family protein [Gammaproteobacteria bacterium]|nr:RDD family protein [Gammaproteobacteria bacterium]NNJ91897.1 RDD family protein [Gammaproteobacteria bacterium]
MPENIPVASVGIMRRLAAILYDVFLLGAVILVAVSLFTIVVESIAGQSSSGELLQIPWIKVVFQLYLFVVSALFYLWFWTHGGQTLGLKVWKLKVVDNDLCEPDIKKAGLRLVWAIVTCIPFGLGYLWALFNKERLTLYDQLSGTRLVQLEKND